MDTHLRLGCTTSQIVSIYRRVRASTRNSKDWDLKDLRWVQQGEFVASVACVLDACIESLQLTALRPHRPSHAIARPYPFSLFGRSGATEASESAKVMVSGAYRSWIEHGLTQSNPGHGHTRAETQHIGGSGSTMGAVEMGAELFSLHGSFYA